MPHQCYNLFLIIIRHIHTVIIIGRFSPIVSCIIIVICTSHLVCIFNSRSGLFVNQLHACFLCR